jgi:hypothetical protein
MDPVASAFFPARASRGDRHWPCLWGVGTFAPFVCLVVSGSFWRLKQMLGKIRWMAAAAMVLAQAGSVAWAEDIKIRMLGPTGEDLSNPALGDERIVAIMTYERMETTQLCGSSSGSATPSSMKLTLHADGNYTGVLATSQLKCAGKKNDGVRRKSAVTRHTGKLGSEQLQAFWAKLGRLAPPARDLAANESPVSPAPSAESSGNASSESTLRIQRARGIEGTLSERNLEEVVQSGQLAEESARFMQVFIEKGKID